MQSLLAAALDHHRAGRLSEAERIYRHILAETGDHADTLHLLGMVEYARGGYDDAAGMIRRAIAIDPTQAPYHVNLGTVLQSQGKPADAILSYQQALVLQPDLAEARINLGNILTRLGRLDEAAEYYQQALATNPQSAEAFCNLGNTRRAQDRLEEAQACYERALALKPKYAAAHNNLGVVLFALSRRADAMVHYLRALELDPDDADAHINLGITLAAEDHVVEAIEHYSRALELKPESADAHNNLANILKAQGNFEDAAAHYSRAIAIRPNFVEAHFNRSEIRTFRPGDAELTDLEALAAANLPGAQAVYVHFALAKALEDTGDFGRAFEHLRLGSTLKRPQIQYDEAAAFDLFQRIPSVFDARLFERFRGQGDPSALPVFVLGMPRSGSSLIEQILASHPQVHGAGEIVYIEDVAGVLTAGDPPLPFPECLRVMDGAALVRLGQDYLAHLPAHPSGVLRVVDKLPGNFLNIGLIRLILPNARIIHTVRHPVDTCCSAYSKLFSGGLAFTYDLGELGRYYCRYRDLMAYWHTVLPPGSILDVKYEDVIDDLEGQARRLIDYCGLAWNDNCLRFHQTSRTVSTASAVQVRQPLFRSSIERWRRYETELEPLLRELEKVPLQLSTPKQ